MKLIFKIEHQWTLCLQRLKLSKETMPVVQHSEMKRAFNCGMVQMFYLMINNISKLPEEEQVNVINDIENQMVEYWNSESKAYSMGLIEVAENKRVKCPVCNWKGIVTELKMQDDHSMVCPNCKNPEIVY